jgi:hypothetical protein
MTQRIRQTPRSVAVSRRGVVRAVLLLIALAVVAIVAVRDSSAGSLLTRRDVRAVPAGIASDCSVDVTSALTDFLDGVPDGSTVLFSRGGCYRVDGTLELIGRTGLVIDGRGAMFQTAVTADDDRSHWRLVGGADLTVQDLRIVGADALGGTAEAFVASLQHQMGIDLRGVHGVRILRVSVSRVYGDCVYVGAGDDGAMWTTGVQVRASTCTDAGRSGVSVTAGRDVTVADTSILRPGLWGVDIEPNGGATGAVAVTVSHDLFTPGARLRPFVQAVGASGGGTVSGIAVVDNVVRGAGLDAAFQPAPGQRWSDVTFSRNESDTPTVQPPDGGSRSRAVVTVEDIDGLVVADNHQPGSNGGQAFLLTARTCDVQQMGNSFPGGGPVALVLPHDCQK